MSDAIIRWLRDWLGFSLLPFWIAAGLQLFLSIDFLSSRLTDGALLAYAVAVTVAHASDLPLERWKRSNHSTYHWAGRLLPLWQWFVVITGVALTVIVLIDDLVASGGISLNRNAAHQLFPVASGTRTEWGIGLALAAAVMSLAMIILEQGKALIK